MTPFIVGGLAQGGIYAIATLGLLLTYRSSRVFNFAHGAIAFTVAIAFHEMAFERGWNRAVAGIVAIGMLAPLLGLALWWVLFRHLADAPPTVRLVSTVGLWVALPAVARIAFSIDDEIFDRTGLGPSPAVSHKIFGVAVDTDKIVVFVAAIVVAIAIGALLKYTPFGLAVRSTVDSPRMAEVAGIDTRRVSAGAWMIGTTLAGLSGVLLAPLRGYLEYQYTLLMIAAFAGVVIARFHSLVLGFLGSLTIGLLQLLVQSSDGEKVVKWFLPDDGILIRGVQPSIPFLLMLVFLFVYRSSGRERSAIDSRALVIAATPESETTDQRPWLARNAGLLIAVAAVLAAPLVLSDLWQALAAKGLALGIALLAYVVITGEGGMISLCNVTFAGIGGALTAELATNHGVPTLAAVLIGAIAVVPLGLLAALPSLRLGDLYLALATLAFSELVTNTYFQLTQVNNEDSGVKVPRPRFGGVSFGSDTAFYYLLVGLFVVAALLVLNLKRSTTGLNLSAMRSSEPATATLGVSVLRAKLTAFGVGAFLAGLGGGLYVTYQQLSKPSSGFGTAIGVVWLAVVVTWGVRSVTGALLAGLSYALFPQLFAQYPWVILVIFGLIAVGQASDATRRWARATLLALVLVFWVGALLVGTGAMDEVPIIGDQVNEVATGLFGFGAIMVAKEPRGIVYQSTHGARAKRAEKDRRRLAAGAASPNGAAP